MQKNSNRMAWGQAIRYNSGMKKKVIFVCSANYYRSRYAEYYFNWLAGQEQLEWKADSRGLMVGFWGNIGPISHHAVDALKRRGIPLEEQPREPQALTLADLAEADLVVAVKEAEHRAMMTDQFPLWKDRIEYWHVDDLDCAEAQEALPHLEKQVHALVERLRTVDGHNGSSDPMAASGQTGSNGHAAHRNG